VQPLQDVETREEEAETAVEDMEGAPIDLLGLASRAIPKV
jgi:hypothetical protein